MNPLQFCILKQEELEDILKVIMEPNCSGNPLLTDNYLSQEFYKKDTIEIIRNSFKSQYKCNTILGKNNQYNHGIKIDGRLVAVNIRIDLVQEYELLKPLINDPSAKGHHFSSHFTHLGIEALSIGRADYLTRLSVLPEFTGKGIAKRLIYESSKYLLERGYEYFIAVVITVNSLQLMLKLGGEVIRQDSKSESFPYPISIIRGDHKRVIQSYEQLHKKAQKSDLE